MLPLPGQANQGSSQFPISTSRVLLNFKNKEDGLCTNSSCNLLNLVKKSRAKIGFSGLDLAAIWEWCLGGEVGLGEVVV